MNRKSCFLMTVILFGALLAACGSLRKEAFKDTEGNSVLLVNKEEEVRKAVMMTLAEKGFQAEVKDGFNTIKARKVIGDGSTSSTITMDNFLFNFGEKGTKLQVTATEEISKTSSHVKYFWLLFIPIPYGSYDTTAIVETGAINDKIFYASFFQGVKKNLSALEMPNTMK
jgi:hypothetical protein